MASYILLGGGAFARELHDWFTPSLAAAGHQFAGYLDDGDAPMAGTGHGLPHLGPITSYRHDPAHRLVMAIASPTAKQTLAARLPATTFATLVHPTAWLSASARLGHGVIVGVFADISANAQLGDLSTVNGYSSVGHDATLADYATLAGYVDLTGGASVGPASFVGSGARLLPKVSVGARCTVGAGAVVVRSVGDGVTLYAPPARLL